eukprot:1668194-Lingulodinium_polyedra.AAC.1
MSLQMMIVAMRMMMARFCAGSAQGLHTIESVGSHRAVRLHSRIKTCDQRARMLPARAFDARPWNATPTI